MDDAHFVHFNTQYLNSPITICVLRKMCVTMQGQGKSSQWRLLTATVHRHAMNNFTDSASCSTWHKCFQSGSYIIKPVSPTSHPRLCTRLSPFSILRMTNLSRLCASLVYSCPTHTCIHGEMLVHWWWYSVFTPYLPRRYLATCLLTMKGMVYRNQRHRPRYRPTARKAFLRCICEG